MDIKFVELLKSFFPKGKAWEFQTNFNYLIDGISAEFGRIYDSATNFYNNFNIINSETLAGNHGQDYLIISGLYTNRELQRIIVHYLNKDYDLKFIVEDFADFMGINVSWENPHKPFIFGSSKFGDKFGDKDNLGLMELLIKFDSDITCKEYNKMVWLIKYLKPPYLYVAYSDLPPNAEGRFLFDTSKFGDKFKESTVCIPVT